jgi:hypothetical protein
MQPFEELILHNPLIFLHPQSLEFAFMLQYCGPRESPVDGGYWQTSNALRGPQFEYFVFSGT